MTIVIVVDTNFVLDQLQIVQEITERGPAVGIQVVVPETVLRELDGLKSREATAHKARAANDRIFEILANSHPGMRGQRRHEHLSTTLLRGDEAIVDCCLFFMTTTSLVVLFSNDRNICVQALKEGIRTVTWRKELTTDAILEKIVHEAQHVKSASPVPALRPIPLDNPQNISNSFENEHENDSEGLFMEDDLADAPAYDLQFPARIHASNLPRIPQKEYRDSGSLERAVKDTMLLSCQRIVVCAFPGMDPQLKLEILDAHMIWKTFFSLIFPLVPAMVPVLPQSLSISFKQQRVPVTPEGQQQYNGFIIFWGSFCLSLLGTDPEGSTFEDLYSTYHKFFARPGEKVGPAPWVLANDHNTYKFADTKVTLAQDKPRKDIHKNSTPVTRHLAPLESMHSSSSKPRPTPPLAAGPKPAPAGYDDDDMMTG